LHSRHISAMTLTVKINFQMILNMAAIYQSIESIYVVAQIKMLESNPRIQKK